MSKVYKFYSDPGHGWIAVKMSELVRLNIHNNISGYSYVKGATVYLEEDGDATTFAEAKKTAGEAYEWLRKNTNKNSPIRSYASYRKPSVATNIRTNIAIIC